ncbi:ribbon-helix-helix protein, CopG family [Enterococcus faecalis]|nr:CopG family transcriptional regulator [Enterococcus faecalis]MCD5250652.1 ribbon-helix-helix protein, CopG family [Enterococcus faecalis]MCZ1515424.1 ribbon-helix-helix protein, CopG family [Enterococcus faecium]QRG98927.1 ribbon-helix-helix protein, CopG family [Enterococcus faecalis]
MAKKRLTITLSPAVLEYLENTAKEKGLSKSAVITVALEEYKKGQKKA